MTQLNLTPTTVENAGLTALIKRLGQDCRPDQFVREFIQNGMEAVSRLQKLDKEGNPIPRKVTVDVDWAHFNQTLKEDGEGQFKISFIDSGDGMAPDDMVRLLNRLSASGHNNAFENYGVGAKIAAFTRNHAGIVYESWVDGKGHRLTLGYDEESNRYGIIPVHGTYKSFETLELPEDWDKPQEIKDHGTKVTLMGMTYGEDTMAPPEGLVGRGGKDEWLRLYTKLRYFTVPEDIELRVRVRYHDPEDTQHSTLAPIKGQKEDLDRAARASGVVNISDAKVYWWLFDGDRTDHGRSYTKGHTACVHENEIFDFANNRISKAAGFGITIGRENVVIYVQAGSGYRQNVARTGLTDFNGNELPWDRWQDEFRAQMPEELQAYVEEKLGSLTNADHSDSIRNKLKKILHLYNVSRYRPRQGGVALADPESPVNNSMGRAPRKDPDVNPTPPEPSETPKPRKARKPGQTVAEALAAQMEEGVASDKITPDPMPTFTWLSLADKTRTIDDHLEDRAAFYQPKDNSIEANADFQGFLDVVEEVDKAYPEVDGSLEIVKDKVHEVYELQLREVVMGALSLRNRKTWSSEQFNAAVSPEALTTAVMCRYHQLILIKRDVGAALKEALPMSNAAAAVDSA